MIKKSLQLLLFASIILSVIGFFIVTKQLAPFFLIFTSILLLFQALITLIWMTYQWYDPETINTFKAQKSKPNSAQLSFSLLVPARHEAEVIGDTIKAIAQIDYPNNKYEALILCRQDDIDTIVAVQTALDELNQTNIRLVTFTGGPTNKAHSLNRGIAQAQYPVIGIFDAEDEPHRDILTIINNALIDSPANAVQAGVQLMNYRSSWFSSLNVLEYFFWFRSGLVLFNKLTKATPMGGNTVFFRKVALEKIGGWSETCLTEDALVGIRLASQKNRIKIMYDQDYVTQEETPPTLESFIKQRTRWQQGFLQILFSDEWLKLPKLHQKLLVLFLVAQPLLLASIFIILPINILISFMLPVSIWLTLFTYLPFYFLLMILLIQTIGLYEFTKTYNKEIGLRDLWALWAGFIPYLLVLGFASFRAVIRLTLQQTSWEKTVHTNAHRTLEKAKHLPGKLAWRGSL